MEEIKGIQKHKLIVSLCSTNNDESKSSDINIGINLTIMGSSSPCEVMIVVLLYKYHITDTWNRLCNLNEVDWSFDGLVGFH